MKLSELAERIRELSGEEDPEIYIELYDSSLSVRFAVYIDADGDIILTP